MFKKIHEIIMLSIVYVNDAENPLIGIVRLIRISFEVIRGYGLKGFFNAIKTYKTLVLPENEITFNKSATISAIGKIYKPDLCQEIQDSVDIIICIHNALEDVKKCLASILEFSSIPYKLILIDDGSDSETSNYLVEFVEKNNADLLRNESAKGYTFAANQGLKLTQSQYFILLNSDTIVGANWLEGLIRCANSSKSIGIVGPLSNTASWQSIPEISSGGEWADNPLPAGYSIAKYVDVVRGFSGNIYPLVPFLNGFCLLIKREVVEKIGYFDELNFGKGYGEENDFCIRARKAGWDLAVADDVFIFHAQSKSYSNEKRKKLYKHAERALLKKHGHEVISRGVNFCINDKVLNGIRAHAKVNPFRNEILETGREKYSNKKVFFLLPAIEVGGGANVVIQEAQALKIMGVEVKIVNYLPYRKFFQRRYSETNSKVPVIYYKDQNHLYELTKGIDVIIATACHSVSMLKDISHAKKVYYIQDFEPYFFDEGTIKYKEAFNSYGLFEDLIRITKTEWNRDEVLSKVGLESKIIGPSVNLDLFRPRNKNFGDFPHRPLIISAMVRPASPRRGPKITMEVLKTIKQSCGNGVEVVIFGCSDDDPGFRVLPRDFEYHNAGILKPEQMAWLLNEVDIFLDFSVYQAMGLTAMEAMACGAAVIAPKAGGAKSFIKHEENGILVDTMSFDECFNLSVRLIKDHPFRSKIQKNAILDMANYFPEKSAISMLDNIFCN